MGLTRDDNRHAYHVLRNYGNMSSATVLFVLREVLAHATPADHGAPVLSFAFGPGLTMEAMLLGISINGEPAGQLKNHPAEAILAAVN